MKFRCREKNSRKSESIDDDDGDDDDGDDDNDDILYSESILKGLP